LQDIINTGVAFANFLLGLSGAVLLGVFVWGSSLYIFFAYDSGKAKKGKEMIVNGAVGMCIIILAGTLIRFIVSSLNVTVPSPATPTTQTTPAAR